jgi:hypothetical protein
VRALALDQVGQPPVDAVFADQDGFAGLAEPLRQLATPLAWSGGGAAPGAAPAREDEATTPFPARREEAPDLSGAVPKITDFGLAKQLELGGRPPKLPEWETAIL